MYNGDSLVFRSLLPFEVDWLKEEGDGQADGRKQGEDVKHGPRIHNDGGCRLLESVPRPNDRLICAGYIVPELKGTILQFPGATQSDARKGKRLISAGGSHHLCSRITGVIIAGPRTGRRALEEVACLHGVAHQPKRMRLAEEHFGLTFKLKKPILAACS